MVAPEILNQVVARLVERFHPQRIILFGSQARGDADSRSDVDLLVVYPFEGRRLEAMWDLEKAMGDLPVATDLIPLTPEQYEGDRRHVNTLAAIADREGKLLYSSDAPFDSPVTTA